jgi:DMSO reductase anchor subunit
MLALSQTGVGLFTAGLLTASRPLALAGALAFFGGLFASVLHLGRPLGAWRFFLGLKRSWLSREILAFGLTAIAMTIGVRFTGALSPAAGAALGSVAWLAVFTSVMVYADTRRPTWSTPRTAMRFFGTAGLAVLLGLALQGSGSALPFAAALTLKLLLESLPLLGAYHRDWSPLRHAARLQLHPLRRVLQARMVLGAGAAAAAPLWLPGACLAFFAGELAERLLFFRSVAAVRMPGAHPAG